MNEIVRSPYYRGTIRDFKSEITGMAPIKGVQGVNENGTTYWVHPTNSTIIHLIRIEDHCPFEKVYVWTKTAYDPHITRGYNGSGNKVVKIAGKTRLLHNIIAATFVSRASAQQTQVIHRDGDKRNNDYRNLMWVSPREYAEYRKQRLCLPLKLNIRKKNNC